MSQATELDGRVAVVTGGANGIGLAIVRELLQAGAAVVLGDLHGADARAKELSEQGTHCVGVEVDVTSPSETEAMIACAAEEFGAVDILVNNAGVFSNLEHAPLEELSVREWERVMRVNVLGPYLCLRAAVSHMRRQGGGRVVNIGSTSPLKGVSHLLHYTTSKSALLGMTRSAARELGPSGILVNLVAPGFTLSESAASQAGPIEQMRSSAPSRRVLQREQLPADIVGSVRFLAGPMASFITGQMLVVDGGGHFN